MYIIIDLYPYQAISNHKLNQQNLNKKANTSSIGEKYRDVVKQSSITSTMLPQIYNLLIINKEIQHSL